MYHPCTAVAGVIGRATTCDAFSSRERQTKEGNSCCSCVQDAANCVNASVPCVRVRCLSPSTRRSCLQWQRKCTQVQARTPVLREGRERKQVEQQLQHALSFLRTKKMLIGPARQGQRGPPQQPTSAILRCRLCCTTQLLRTTADLNQACVLSAPAVP